MWTELDFVVCVCFHGDKLEENLHGSCLKNIPEINVLYSSYVLPIVLFWPTCNSIYVCIYIGQNVINDACGNE